MTINTIKPPAVDPQRRRGLAPGVMLSIGLMLLLLTVAGTAQAILIRHDTGYTRYVANEADYPSVFYLHRNQHRRVCVATLITPQWAITAAHCTHETPLLDTLEAEGRYPVTIAGQSAAIARVHWHPYYPEAPAGKGPDVDLALLRLEQPLRMPRPMPLYRDHDELGQVVTFLGWGFHGLGRGGRYRDDGRFRFAHNTVVEADLRLRFVFDDPREPGSAALPFEGVPGLGDSGGPALIRSDQGYAIAGVAVGEVSGPQSAARQGLYGAEFVYERVSRHQAWIEQTISGGPVAGAGLTEASSPDSSSAAVTTGGQ